MSRIVPFNKTGIIGLQSIEAKIVNNTLTYVFEAHPYVNAPFNGLLLVYLNSTSPAELTPDMPVYFETQGMSNTRKAVTKAGGVPLVAADITTPCYNLFFYDFSKGVVEAVSGVINIA